LFLPENLTISTAKYVDILARTLLQFNVERTHIAVYDVLDAPKKTKIHAAEIRDRILGGKR